MFDAYPAYVIYSNLTGIARVWLEKGVLPAGIGIWWVPVLLLLAAFILLYQQYESARLFFSHRVAHMRVIDRHIALQVIINTLLVLLVLTALASIITFVG